MIAWIWFVSTRRSTPLTISVPSSARATCRLCSSSSAKFVRPVFMYPSGLAGRFVTNDSRGPPDGSQSSGPLLCSVHERLLQSVAPRDLLPDRAPPLRDEASPRDGPLARQGHARVQGVRDGTRCGRR